jgi:hypothetical protein
LRHRAKQPGHPHDNALVIKSPFHTQTLSPRGTRIDRIDNRPNPHHVGDAPEQFSEPYSSEKAIANSLPRYLTAATPTGMTTKKQPIARPACATAPSSRAWTIGRFGQLIPRTVQKYFRRHESPSDGTESSPISRIVLCRSLRPKLKKGWGMGKTSRREDTSSHRPPLQNPAGPQPVYCADFEV